MKEELAIIGVLIESVLDTLEEKKIPERVAKLQAQYIRAFKAETGLSDHDAIDLLAASLGYLKSRV